MGRKSKRKYNHDPEDVAKADKKEVLLLCAQLFEIASKPSSLAPVKQWEEFLQINSLVEKIRKKQHDTSFETSTNRHDHIEEFMAWARGRGISCDCVAIQDFKEKGLGLRAVQEIKEQEPFLTIPRKAILTEDNVLDSPLGSLIRNDRILQGMAHVSLALFLLLERLTENSEWKPYINILPMASSYHLPLYFTPNELQQLQGSPAFSDALKQHKNIGRQFAYFYKLFQTLSESTKLPLKGSFTYEGYRWAVSTVMSRQNQIPSQDGSHLVTALIPMWDMCNHTNGMITTSFNLQRDCCQSLALHDVDVGDQVCIFYGLRCNAHLLLYSGFVYPESECDSVTIHLGVSKNDRLYAMKSQLLAMMGSAESSVNLPVQGGDDPISPELIAFLRVFCMNEEELVQRMFDKNKAESLGKLVQPNSLVSKANELRVWSFLDNRLSLLLRQYKSTLEEDIEQLKSSQLTTNTRMCLQLKITEKYILRNAVKHVQLSLRTAEELAEDASSYEMRMEEEVTKTRRSEVTDSVANDTRRDATFDDVKDDDEAVIVTAVAQDAGGETDARSPMDEAHISENDRSDVESTQTEDTQTSDLLGNQSDDSGTFDSCTSSSLLPSNTQNGSIVSKVTVSVDKLNNSLKGINLNGGGPIDNVHEVKCCSNGHGPVNGE